MSSYKKNIAFFCLFIGIGIYFFAIITLASLPPVARDSLTHHLVVPKLYIANGGIYEISEIEFSYYPQLLELLYTIPLYFKNDIIPSYIHFFFGLLTSYVIFCYLKSKTAVINAFIAAFFFLTLPVIVKLSVSAYVDLGLYFFSFASLYFLILWYRHYRFRDFFLSGAFCGFAMSCKYNGIITFFCLIFSLLWLVTKKPILTKNAIRSLFLFCSISILVFSPWMLKNYIWTGNPVYPLYKDFFNPTPEKQIQTSDMKNEKRSHFYYRRVVFKESLAETLSTPVRIFFQAKDDDPKFFDGVMSPFLFFMPFIAIITEFIRYKKKQEPDYERILLFLFSWVYILFVYFQIDMRIRWVGPAIAPLTVLSFIGVYDIWNFRFKNIRTSYALKSVLVTVVAFMFFMNFEYMLDLYKKVDPLSYLSGLIKRDDYIQKHRPEYSAYQYINKNLPQGAKIYGLMLGNRRYYCDRSMITDESILRACVNDASSSSDIKQYLFGLGVTHIVMDNNIYSFWSDGIFTEDKKQLLHDFWKRYSTQLFNSHGFSVYEIVK